MGEVLQKLLVPAHSTAVGERGYPYVGGPVTRLADVRGLSTPEDLLAAYGLEGSGVFGEDPDFVDVLRFEVEPLMRLRMPGGEARPWPTYPTGFLTSSSDVVPVWVLERTRVPKGAEMWRIHRSGDEERVTRFDGAARGWRGAAGVMPVTQLVGPRAAIGGREFVADFMDASGERVELVWFGDDVPGGFEPAAPGVSTRVIASAECDQVHEVVLSASWRGVDARVLQPAADEALLLLDQPTAEQVEALGAHEVEPGYFEVIAPKGELVDGGGVSNALQ